MARSIFGRVWDATKPPPAVNAPSKPRRRLNPKQKRLFAIAASVLILAGGSWSVYAYIAAAPERAQTEFDAGMKLMTPGTYPKAVARFTRAIEIWPTLAKAYLERGIAHKALNETDLALSDFDRAIDRDPDLAAAYNQRGTIFLERDDLKRAEQEFTKSIATQPSVDAYIQRARTYESLGEHQKAIDDFNEAIARMPDSPDVYRARSIARRNLGDQAGYVADRDTARGIEISR
ncbi:MAG: tetratricopeptide repeat protein [Bryobacteraceae bacterium]